MKPNYLFRSFPLAAVCLAAAVASDVVQVELAVSSYFASGLLAIALQDYFRPDRCRAPRRSHQPDPLPSMVTPSIASGAA